MILRMTMDDGRWTLDVGRWTLDGRPPSHLLFKEKCTWGDFGLDGIDQGAVGLVAQYVACLLERGNQTGIKDARLGVNAQTSREKPVYERFVGGYGGGINGKTVGFPFLKVAVGGIVEGVGEIDRLFIGTQCERTWGLGGNG